MDLNAQDNEGNTALHYACYFFHLGAWSHYYMQNNQLEEVALFSVILFKLLDCKSRSFFWFWIHQSKLTTVAIPWLLISPKIILTILIIIGGARVDVKNNEGKAPIDILPNILQLDRSLVQLVEEYKASHKEDNEEKPPSFGGGFGQSNRPQFF